MPAVGFGALFVASLLPVVKVFIMCSIGALVSTMGLLTVEARRVISGLIFNIFVPCLFLDHLGAGEGFLSAIKLWPLTFNMVATHVLGGILGALLVLVARPPARVKNHMVVATMIGNTGNLPLVLIASLGDDPALAWLGGSALGIQYVILGNFSAAFFQFPITTALLRKPPPGDAPPPPSAAAPAAPPAPTQSEREGERDTARSSAVAAQQHQQQEGQGRGEVLGQDQGQEAEEGGQERGQEVERTRLLAPTALPSDLPPGTAQGLERHLSVLSVQEQQQLEQGEEPQGQAEQELASVALLPLHHRHHHHHENVNGHADASPQSAIRQAGQGSHHKEPAPGAQQDTASGSGAVEREGAAAWSLTSTSSSSLWSQRVTRWWEQQVVHRWKRWRGHHSPGPPEPPMSLAQRWKQLQPVMSGIVSPPTIACVVALTVASIKPLQSLLYGPEAPLRLVGETLAMLGDLTIPCLMLVLGANLAKGPGAGKGMPMRCVAATIVCRLVLLPLAGTGMVLCMRAWGMLNDLQPIGIISMLLTHAVPTAIMVHSMSVMYSNSPDEVATLLFWEYTASAITVPCLLAFFLHLVSAPAS